MTTMVGLYVEYKAKTQEIDAAFGKIQREIDVLKQKQAQAQTGFTQMHSKMSSGLGELANQWKTFIAAAAVGFIVHGFNAIAESIDKISESAGAMGLNVEAFQRLQFVGKLAGVSVEQLDTSIKKMSMTLGDAFQGGESKDVFEKLKLSLSELKGLDPTQQFTKIADVLGRISDKNIQASLAAKIFGRDYVSALKVINQGVDETGKKFDALGIGLSTTQVQAVAKYKDAIDTLGAVFTSLGQKLVVFIAPAATAIAEFVLSVMEKMGGLSGIFESFWLAISKGAQLASSGLNVLINALSKVKDKFEELQQTSWFQYLQGQASGVQNRLAMVGRFAVTGSVDPNVIGTPSGGPPESSYSKIINPLESILTDVVSVTKTAGDSLASAVKNMANNLEVGSKKVDDFFSKFVRSEGQKKLTEILGAPKTSAEAAYSNEQLDRTIKEIYNKAILGKSTGYRAGNTTGLEFNTTPEQDVKYLEKMINDLSANRNIGDLSGYTGALAELKDLVNKVDPSTQKVKLEIKIDPTDNFIVKVANSEALNSRLKNNIIIDFEKVAAASAK